LLISKVFIKLLDLRIDRYPQVALSFKKVSDPWKAQAFDKFNQIFGQFFFS